MGQEAVCTVRFGDEVSEGKLLLEQDFLYFRGAFRLKVPFRDMQALTANGSALKFRFQGKQAICELGKLAAKWADRIQNPPSRLDKLGVKPVTRVRLIGKASSDFLKELKSKQIQVTGETPDLTFFFVETKEDLAGVQEDWAPVWIVYPKGIAEPSQNDVLETGRAAGLVDVKVCAFSDRQSALKFTKRKPVAVKVAAATRSGSRVTRGKGKG